jgi:NitT/TauT family transport system permease protein
MMKPNSKRQGIVYYAGHAAGLAAVIVLWEVAAQRGWVDATFFGKPSAILGFLEDGFVTGKSLWRELGYTLGATLLSFIGGSLAAVAAGMLFAALPRLHRALDPYLTLFNAMPRIALAPLFLMWFGLGIGSKVAVGLSLAFFIVLSSTLAGIRGVNADILTLSRSLGCSPIQIFFKVTLPSAVPIIFSGLRLGLIYSMLGVVGAELIAAEHGLGQQLAYLQSNFDTSGVMGILLLLAALGLLITTGMSRLERKLLGWQ